MPKQKPTNDPHGYLSDQARVKFTARLTNTPAGGSQITLQSMLGILSLQFIVFIHRNNDYKYTKAYQQNYASSVNHICFDRHS